MAGFMAHFNREMCEFAEEIWNFVKALIAFIISNIAVGMSFQAKEIVNFELAKATHHKGTVASFSNIFTTSFVIVYIINVFCLAYTFVGLSCVRRCVFDRETGRSSRTCGRVQCCLGPFVCGNLLQTLAFLSLIIQVIFSWGYLLLALVLGIVAGFCRAGDSTISSFQGLLESYSYNMQSPYQAHSWSPVNWFMDINVTEYCAATNGMGDAAYQCFQGCGWSVISQLIMLAVISEEKGRLQVYKLEDMTKDPREPGEDMGDHRHHRRHEDEEYESSSSSSNSDYESDPRRKKHKRSTKPSKYAKGYQPQSNHGSYSISRF